MRLGDDGVSEGAGEEDVLMSSELIYPSLFLPELIELYC